MDATLPARPRAIPDATVRVAALEGWAALLRARGLDAAALAPQWCGVGDPTATMPLAQFVAFSEGVVATTRDLAIPWLVGTHYDLASLGQIGQAINAASRVGTALRRFVDYFTLLQDCTDIRLTVEDDCACINYRILDPEIWPRHSDALFSLGIIAQVIRRGHGAQWDKVEFAFEAQASAMRGPMAQIVHAPCVFGADGNQLRFPAAFLDLPLPAAAPASMAPDARALGRALVARRREQPVSERLAGLVWRDLNAMTIDQERLAREIGMSSRTMRRKLAEEGSSFQHVLDACRMAQALFEFRTRPDLSIAEIALRLGYAEHSNFTRAFHRWTGEAPQQWRARMGGPTRH